LRIGDPGLDRIGHEIAIQDQEDTNGDRDQNRQHLGPFQKFQHIVSYSFFMAIAQIHFTGLKMENEANPFRWRCPIASNFNPQPRISHNIYQSLSEKQKDVNSAIPG
jgi:hypothetical protein